MTTGRFCDVAHPYQAGLPLRLLADLGDTLVALKATEGTGYVTPGLPTRIAEARAAGLQVWAYHFARPGDPAAQADHFAQAIAGLDVAAVCLDLEVPVGPAQPWADAFAARLAQRGHHDGVLYTGRAFAQDQRLTPPPGWNGWLAAYQTDRPADPPGWAGRTCAWQYTDRSTVPHYAGTVDRSVLLLPPTVPQEDDMTPDEHAALVEVLTHVRNLDDKFADMDRVRVADWFNRVWATFNVMKDGASGAPEPDWWIRKALAEIPPATAGGAGPTALTPQDKVDIAQAVLAALSSKLGGTA